MLPNTPRFLYGASEFIPSLPARFWTPGDETVGGVHKSSTGLPTSYIIRRDALLELIVRFSESEWGALLNLVAFGQTGQTFLWYPDAAQATNYAVYLEEPAAGASWRPTRSGEYPRNFEATLVLRGAAGAIPWQPYF